ncbi:hypothetical protein F511_47380 [Dorcoceras hygrometricum]|uniref:Uncharacterized protein n=1 Tax=Dorcoceras hygrometricum TaxID=472368 RepID=A0A2Z6ZR78_9LAMI|nr:hypothetical protein F511_47380 [Dorcoceras hygrometricum]
MAGRCSARLEGALAAQIIARWPIVACCWSRALAGSLTQHGCNGGARLCASLARPGRGSCDQRVAKRRTRFVGGRRRRAAAVRRRSPADCCDC